MFQTNTNFLVICSLHSLAKPDIRRLSGPIGAHLPNTSVLQVVSLAECPTWVVRRAGLVGTTSARRSFAVLFTPVNEAEAAVVEAIAFASRQVRRPEILT